MHAVEASKAPTHICTNVMDMCMMASELPEGGSLSLVNQALHMPDAARCVALSASQEPVPVAESLAATLWPRAAAITQKSLQQGLFSLQKGEKGAVVCPIRGGEKMLADMDLHLGPDNVIVLGSSCKNVKLRNVAFFGARLPPLVLRSRWPPGTFGC